MLQLQPAYILDPKNVRLRTKTRCIVQSCEGLQTNVFDCQVLIHGINLGQAKQCLGKHTKNLYYICIYKYMRRDTTGLSHPIETCATLVLQASYCQGEVNILHKEPVMLNLPNLNATNSLFTLFISIYLKQISLAKI